MQVKGLDNKIAKEHLPYLEFFITSTLILAAKNTINSFLLKLFN
jgi:hypothetical protein